MQRGSNRAEPGGCVQRRHYLIETGRSAPGLALLTGAALALAALVVTVARLNLTPVGTAPPMSAVIPGEPSPAAVSHPARLPDKWAEADVNTRRLHPDAFGDVPPSVRRELVRLGCTIPQTFGSDRPHNIISGRFMSPARTDWAALCSRDRISTILVFPAGEAASAIEVAAAPDVATCRDSAAMRLASRVRSPSPTRSSSATTISRTIRRSHPSITTASATCSSRRAPASSTGIQAVGWN